MGNSNVTSINNAVNALNQITTNVVNQAIASGKVVSSNRNFLDLDFTGAIVNCDITLNQKIQIDQNLKILSKFQSASDLQTMLQNIVDQASQSSQTAINDFLSLGLNSNVSKANLSIKSFDANFLTSIPYSLKIFLVV